MAGKGGPRNAVFLLLSDLFAFCLGYGFVVSWLHGVDRLYILLPHLSGLAIIGILMFFLFGLYHSLLRKKGMQQWGSILLPSLLLAGLAMAINPWVELAEWWALLAAGMLQFLCMALFRSMSQPFSHRKRGKVGVWVIGETALDATLTAEKFTLPQEYEIRGISTRHELPKAMLLKDEWDILTISSSLSRECKAEILRHLYSSDKVVVIIPDWYELMLGQSLPIQIRDHIALRLDMSGPTRVQRRIKAILDRLLALILLVFFSPLMLLLFLLIPLTSRGPALYIQERVGLHGNRFRLYKFRTMIEHAEKHSGPVLTLEKDPRVTPLGRVLRASRLDELPQLFNVLLGDMSLVGPRPERPYFVEQFVEAYPAYSLRHCVKPGITGLAQVLANYHTTAEEKWRFDFYYITHYSLLLDIQIMLLTILVAFSRNQARGLPQATRAPQPEEHKEKALS